MLHQELARIHRLDLTSAGLCAALRLASMHVHVCLLYFSFVVWLYILVSCHCGCTIKALRLEIPEHARCTLSMRDVRIRLIVGQRADSQPLQCGFNCSSVLIASPFRAMGRYCGWLERSLRPVPPAVPLLPARLAASSLTPL